MVAWLVGMFVFSQLQVKRVLSYPHQKIMTEFNEIWDSQTNSSEFKYVCGHIDYVFQFHVYNNRHPKVILETFGYKNPWVDHNDIIKSGVLVVGKSKKNLIHNVKEMVVLLPDNYKIEPKRYDFVVTNTLCKSKKYKFYYVIIPPQKND